MSISDSDLQLEGYRLIEKLDEVDYNPYFNFYKAVEERNDAES
jgi:hypothetical protein